MAGWGYDVIGALDATPGTEELRAVAARVERVDTGALADLARRYAALAEGMDTSLRAVADRGDGVGRAWQGPGADAFARYTADFARAGSGTGEAARRIQGELAGLGRTLAALREEVAGHVSDALDLARSRPDQVRAAVATPTARAQAALDRVEEEVADCARRLRGIADGGTGFSRLRSPDAGVMSASSGASARWSDRQGAVLGADEPVRAARILDGGSADSGPDGGSGGSGGSGSGTDDGGTGSAAGSDGGGSGSEAGRGTDDGGTGSTDGADRGGSSADTGGGTDDGGSGSVTGSDGGGSGSEAGRGTDDGGTGSADRSDGAADGGDRGSRADAADPGNAERYDTGSEPGADDQGGDGVDDGRTEDSSADDSADEDSSTDDSADEDSKAEDSSADDSTADDDKAGDDKAGDDKAEDSKADDGRAEDDEADAGTGTAPSSGKGGVQDWIRQATAILAENGVDPDKMKADDIATIIEHESGGDPDAVNNWDSNADKGTPSKGLMQTIGPTFEANKLPGHDDITDPVDNIIAAVRYAIRRYGSVGEVPGVEAVARGDSYVGY